MEVSMNKNFVDQVEAIASFQYHSEEAMNHIDKFILRVQALEGVDKKEQAHLLEILTRLKPMIIQRLQLKALDHKNMQ
jgi:bacterioferritin (cytochrome b1)